MRCFYQLPAAAPDGRIHFLIKVIIFTVIISFITAFIFLLYLLSYYINCLIAFISFIYRKETFNVDC